jgi:hypothetical protein
VRFRSETLSSAEREHLSDGALARLWRRIRSALHVGIELRRLAAIEHPIVADDANVAVAQ